MRRILTSLIWLLVGAAVAIADDPAATAFSFSQCRGSMALYPTDITRLACPDSLTPVLINHVGRHGSRFPASPKAIERLTAALQLATERGTITATGKELLSLCRRITAATTGQWGALDSLGMAEERGIASRMVRNFPSLFKGGRVEAISSYSPRCIMSMYSFTHQLARLDNKIEISTSSGRQFSYLLRPFDDDPDYVAYREADAWESTLDAFKAQTLTLEPLKKALGDIADYSDHDARQLALDEYTTVAGAAAAGVSCNPELFFSREQFNSLWQAFNMRQYLLYSANTLSTIPADIASPLLLSIIVSTEAAATGEKGGPTVMLRFGHAETLMPLLALLRLKGCYYMTNYFDTVASHWQDFNIVPMAANVQFILLKNKKGRMYLRVDLNERPIPLMPGSDEIYLPWDKARDYMNRCIPIFYQP